MLNIGLDLGVLPRPWFAMMVLMVLVTTPLLQWMGEVGAEEFAVSVSPASQGR